MTSWFVDSGTYPTRDGNHVRLLVDGVPAFRRICEAIESADHSVWATITFMWPTFEMPDGRGTALDVFQRAAERGIDVRLIFWRPELTRHRRNAFWGSSDHLALLNEGYPDVNVRWDYAAEGYCQHQKTWMIDADGAAPTSFVGGINLNPHASVVPGHPYVRGIDPQFHDAYVELQGPSVADVQHNFVQRWNESSERGEAHGVFGPASNEDLAFPSRTPSACGGARVQVQRTVHGGLYADKHAPPGGREYDISGGERTNLDQYCAAIAAASRTIYMENQYVEVAPIVEALHGALRRGVEVVMVLPATPDFGHTTTSKKRAEFLELRTALSEYSNFSLCGLASEDHEGRRTTVYVHDKLMLVDDAFATIGSCNLHHYSLYGNGELNVAIEDSAAVTSMRCELFAEHLGQSVASLDDLAAIRLFKSIARQNRDNDDNGSAWLGLAFEMDMATYTEREQLAI